jgi:predicted Fe-Mo cluster-binding NifX family protein
MKIAIPLTESGTFTSHYGAAFQLAVYEIDAAAKTVGAKTLFRPNAPTPCGWGEEVAAAGVSALLVGGMGGGAAAQMQARGVQVVAGVPDAEPDVIAEAYVRGLVCCGTNACAGGHSQEGACHDHHEHAEGGCHCANG